ncbi:MAG TPA: cupredoxin family protein, partial [Terriglobales bacterium]
GKKRILRPPGCMPGNPNLTDERSLMNRVVVLSLLLAGVSLAGVALGHGDKSHQAAQFTEYGDQREFGRAGKSSEAKRTVVVEMTDLYRFKPSALKVKKGETVRLVFRNTGVQVHEWVIGTPKEIAEHAEMMRRFPNMEHDEVSNVHVPPGQERELVWQFNRSGTFEFACLLPGHHEAGMKGTTEVQ